MKPSSLKLIICTAFMLFAYKLKAQDYVIKANGDSVACTINKPLIGAMKYQPNGSGGYEKITPETIKEYYIAKRNNMQHSVMMSKHSKPVFMTVIEKGKINLYELIVTMYTGTMTTESKTWYASKGEGEVIELKTSSLFLGTSKQKRKDELADMFMDNNDVYNKYQAEDKFSFNQIRLLVHLYNTGK